MPYDPFLPPEPFSLSDIISKCRGGAFPPDWPDAYGDYLRRSHTRAAAEIAAIFAEAEGDPAALARLNDARF
ncbi:MAG TPA: hypothetical protein VGM25_08960 [Caulobacteraceae bacterium]|jgi:hypothetical protein